VNRDLLKDTDVHIHFPAGAISKDGPSAGVAIATVLVSLFADRCVRSDTAMTGEVTLRGLVLSVFIYSLMFDIYSLLIWTDGCVVIRLFIRTGSTEFLLIAVLSVLNSGSATKGFYKCHLVAFC